MLKNSLDEFMETITLYHGSNVKVEKPEIMVMGFYKDLGYGFFCTILENQTNKWALTKKDDSVVSVCDYRLNESLKATSFPSMTEE